MKIKTTLALLLISTMLILSGCDIQMTYYPSVKSDTKNLYYTLEYDFSPEALQKTDENLKVPLPMLDTELLAYVTKASTNVPYYRDEKSATYAELPFFYDLKKLKKDPKFKKLKKLTVTYQIDASTLNVLPEDLKVNEKDLPNQVKPYLILSKSDESAALLATSLTATLPPQDKHTLKSLNALYEGWILKNIQYPVSYKDFSQSLKGPRTTAQLIQNKVGTSEDISQLLVAMFRSQGIPARIVTGLDGVLIERKSDPRKPADLKLLEDGFHTQVEVFASGRWYLLDPCLYPNLKSNVTNIDLPSGQLLNVYKSDLAYERKPLMPMGYLSINDSGRSTSEPLLNSLNSSTPSSVYLD